MGRDAIEAVKASVTARDVALALGLDVDRNGRCRCLWHDDRHPSLKLYDGDRGCYCFACHGGGSVIDMVQQANRCTLPEALGWLNEAFSLGIDLDGKRPSRAEIEAARADRERRAREREAAHRAKMELFEAWADACRTIGDLKDDRARYAPKPGDTDWDPRFTAALLWLPRMERIADELADRMGRIDAHGGNAG